MATTSDPFAQAYYVGVQVSSIGDEHDAAAVLDHEREQGRRELLRELRRSCGDAEASARFAISWDHWAHPQWQDEETGETVTDESTLRGIWRAYPRRAKD